MKHNGKVVLITGAGKGIGKEIVLKLAREGASIAACDVDKKNLDQLTIELESITDQFLNLQIDVTKKEEVTTLFLKAVEKFGKIDASIQNAGVGIISRFLETDEKVIDWIMAANFKGVFFCCQEAIKQMLKQGYGKIINNASAAGREGVAYESIYSSSKFAVIGLTQCLAKEFGGNNITVNAFCPGIVMTDMWKKSDRAFGKILGVKPGDTTKEFIKDIPLNRSSTPADLIGTVSFLVSNDSDYITGQTIGVDGGLIM